jgi:hypothetical protein
MTRALTRAELDRWDEDGFLLLRQLLPESVRRVVLSSYHAELDRRIARLRQEHGAAVPAPPGSASDVGDLALEDYYGAVACSFPSELGNHWRTCMAMKPAIYRLAGTTNLVEVIQQLAGVEIRGHAEFNHKPKMPRNSLLQGGAAWHQDGFYFGPETEASLIIGCWTPMVPVTVDNGCMQVVAGSHRPGYQAHAMRDREGQTFFEVAAPIDPNAIVTCPMEPGDVLLFRSTTIHRGLPNLSARIRWSVDIRYVRGGDTPGETHFADPAAEWVIASDRHPVTTEDDWMKMIAETNAVGGPTRGVVASFKSGDRSRADGARSR